MGVLDRLKTYQKLQAMETTPETLPAGQISEGTSFLQQFILEMLKKNNVPVHALKFVPGFGPQLEKLLFGNPYECHTYFADMIYHVQQLLEQDKDFDPTEQARRQELAEAEKRARYRASLEPACGGSINGAGQDGQRQEHTVRYSDEAISSTLSNVQSSDY